MKRAIILFVIIMLAVSCKKTTSVSNYSQDETKAGNNINSSNKVTFIELGSVNCIPCKMMQPVMKKVEENYKDKVNVVFYDVWTEKGAPKAQEYRIRVIPTQIFLDSDGVEYFRHEGYLPYDELEKIIKMKL